jgi:thymidine phosphorylase
VVAELNAFIIGHTATAMGAGREKKEDDVDPLAGIVLNKTIGDAVQKGETLAYLYTRADGRLSDFQDAIRGAFDIRPDALQTRSSLLIDRYADGRWQSRVA